MVLYPPWEGTVRAMGGGLDIPYTHLEVERVRLYWWVFDPPEPYQFKRRITQEPWRRVPRLDISIGLDLPRLGLQCVGVAVGTAALVIALHRRRTRMDDGRFPEGTWLDDQGRGR